MIRKLVSKLTGSAEKHSKKDVEKRREEIGKLTEEQRDKINNAMEFLKEFPVKKHRRDIIEAINWIEEVPIEAGFNEFEGFADGFKSGFIECLRGGFADQAVKIQKLFKKTIDFTKIKGYEEAVITGFLKRLREGYVEEALKIQNKFGKKIKFDKANGYEEAVRMGFLNCIDSTVLENGIDLAIKVRKKLGKDMDFMDFTEEIKTGFLRHIKNASIYFAINIQNRLGKGIDFTQIPGYENAIRTTVKRSLGLGWVKNVEDIIAEWGKDMDYSEELKTGFIICLKNCLRKKDMDEAIKTQEVFGKDVDFSEEIIYLYFRNKLERSPDNIQLIEQSFPDVFEGIKEDKKQQAKALIILCKKLYPEFQNYLENEEPKALSIEEFKNEFHIKNKRHITPELLLKFESIIRFAENYISQTLKNKVKEWGFDPDTPDYKTQLTDDQKLELRQLMQDKQEDVRAKIQHIASPELIRAYQNEQEEGEADFLTLKAA